MIDYQKDQLIDFIRRWKVTEFALFGSVLREDFDPESDVDLLVSFSPSARWSLFDLISMQQQLEEIFGREVDLVERASLLNPYRRRAILDSMKVIYEAG